MKRFYKALFIIFSIVLLASCASTTVDTSNPESLKIDVMLVDETQEVTEQTEGAVAPGLIVTDVPTEAEIVAQTIEVVKETSEVFENLEEEQATAVMEEATEKVDVSELVEAIDEAVAPTIDAVDSVEPIDTEDLLDTEDAVIPVEDAQDSKDALDAVDAEDSGDLVDAVTPVEDAQDSLDTGDSVDAEDLVDTEDAVIPVEDAQDSLDTGDAVDAEDLVDTEDAEDAVTPVEDAVDLIDAGDAIDVVVPVEPGVHEFADPVDIVVEETEELPVEVFNPVDEQQADVCEVDEPSEVDTEVEELPVVGVEEYPEDLEGLFAMTQKPSLLEKLKEFKDKIPLWVYISAGLLILIIFLTAILIISSKKRRSRAYWAAQRQKNAEESSSEVFSVVEQQPQEVVVEEKKPTNKVVFNPYDQDDGSQGLEVRIELNIKDAWVSGKVDFTDETDENLSIEESVEFGADDVENVRVVSTLIKKIEEQVVDVYSNKQLCLKYSFIKWSYKLECNAGLKDFIKVAYVLKNFSSDVNRFYEEYEKVSGKLDEFDFSQFEVGER